MLRHLAWAFVLNAFFISFLSTASAQNARITGVVLDQSNQQPAQGAVVALQGTSFSTLSDEQGRFSLQNIPAGAYKLNIRLDNFVEYNLDVSIAGKDLNLSTIGLAPRGEAGVALKEDLIPTISLSDDNLEVEGNNQNISGILTASRDVFVSAAAFTFGPARFRVRGYDSEYVNVFLNGLPFNDLDNGRVTWNVWGGLNDVTRNREVDLGTGPISYTFGGVGGGNAIDTRASFHRKQLRLSYSLS
ncbi:MAG TPA: carboxypeptidase regulatory-like domain-containing protein, partial [Saprospiraceae bacterium]|nr:carboxypeptidase regulatory-like domain-containing protein [Saprospiraceae bacterium]